MPFAPGSRIGPYVVAAPLGAGGMGEVYRATDTRLNRDVALKVLPDLFARDAERMARFEREAHVLASLNHPNIAAIYGLEDAEQARALVLELVEGPTLAERVAAGALPVQEALGLARQIAEALEAAHEKGIIHRDLKPANVKITPDGAVKVLDFGLAKALEGEGSGADAGVSMSPTITAAATRAGVILGTAAYMSPEQARGRAADRRCDIWAFGVVLLEMLGGRQSFRGETVSDTLASVLKSDPEWDALPPGVPAPVVKLLRRCLDKDAKRRLRDIGEARIVLEEVLAGRIDSDQPAAIAAEPPARGRWPALTLGIVALLAVAGVLLVGSRLRPPAAEAPLRRFAIVIKDLVATYRQTPAISPDGMKVAYAAGGKLWIRDLSQLETREVPGGTAGANPFWSPDGASLAFGANQRLWRVPASGGQPVLICDLPPERFDGGAWGPDDRIVFVLRIGPMYEVSARGGDPRKLMEPELGKETDFHKPQFLPDGRGILFTVHRTEEADTLAVLSGGVRKQILQLKGQRLDHAVYSKTGHILYHRSHSNEGIWAAPFSLSKLEVTADPFMVVPAASVLSLANDGTLIYTQGAGDELRQLVWVDRTGKVLGTIGQPQEGITFVALSPDGTRVALSALENDNRDIWVQDVARGTRTRLTFDTAVDWFVDWTPAGDRLAIARGGSDTIVMKAADGTGEEKTVTQGSLPDISRDGRYLVFERSSPDSKPDLLYLDLQKGGEPIPFLTTPAMEARPALSPDARFLAYVSDESGRFEVYLKKFPSGDGKWQVSVNGGNWPRWSRSGGEIFFAQDALMSVAVATDPVVTLGTPRTLFTAETSGLFGLGNLRNYDESPDGKRFVMVKSMSQTTEERSIVVALNWFKEFEGRK